MRRWPFTLRGTGALVLGILCFALAHEFKIVELLYLSVLLLVVVGVSLATLYLARRSESVARVFTPDVASVGQDVDVRARVQIRSPLPVAQGTWRDELGPGLAGESAGRFPATASGLSSEGRAIELEYRVTALRRGIRTVGPLTVSATDPFGFARRRSIVGAAASLTVAPQAIELGMLTDLPGEAGGSMHSTTNQLGQGADNLIPRHYVSATRCAASTGGRVPTATNSWCGRRSRRPHLRRSWCSTWACSTGPPRRCSRRVRIQVSRPPSPRACRWRRASCTRATA